MRLGHIVDQHGLRSSDKKIQAIVNAPQECWNIYRGGGASHKFY